MVFSGCKNAPASHCSHEGSGPYTTVDATPLIAEKPYITELNDKWTLNVPKYETKKVGVTGNNFQNSDKFDFSQVFVANDKNTADEITAKLDEGLHVVMQPGQYHLTDSIKVNKEDAVLLGIGMATLISTTGKPCIEVANVGGVRVAGVLLQAGNTKSDTLLRWGQSKWAGNQAKPGVMSDVFARVGGPSSSAAE